MNHLSSLPPGVSLTVSEASWLLDRPSAAISQAVDRGLIVAGWGQGGEDSGTLRRLGPAKLRYLPVESELEGDLTPAARRRVYDALRGLPQGEHGLRLGRLWVELGDVDERIAARLGRLEQLRALVEQGPDAVPKLRGTGLPVHAVAALTRGQTVDETLEDCPGLTHEQGEGAAEYARAYPKAGRPHPARSFDRLLGDLGAAMGEDWPEPEATAPRLVP